MDVDSLYPLYPLLDIDQCARVVSQKIYNNDLKFDKLDWKEIALYLRFHLTDKEIRLEGLEHIFPRMKTNKDGQSTFMSSGIAA